MSWMLPGNTPATSTPLIGPVDVELSDFGGWVGMIRKDLNTPQTQPDRRLKGCHGNIGRNLCIDLRRLHMKYQRCVLFTCLPFGDESIFHLMSRLNGNFDPDSGAPAGGKSGDN